MTCCATSNMVLKASFFARTTSLTSWFNQGVLFSLLAAILSRFRQQLSTTDEIIVVRNHNHSISMSSETLEVVKTLLPGSMQTVFSHLCLPGLPI